MLSYLRKHATSFFIKVALGVIVLSFVLWGGFSYQERKENRVAGVNGQYILRDDYQKTLDRLMEQFRRTTGKTATPEVVRAMKLKERALSLLVNDTLLSQAARSLGLTVDDETLRMTILEYPEFKRNGRFDEGLYRALLNQNRLTPSDFEESFRRDLTVNRLKGIVDRTSKVSEAEARLLYDYTHEKRTVYSAAFDPKQYEPDKPPGPEPLKEYFSTHREAYRIPEKRRIVYVNFAARDFEAKVNAGEEEVRTFYNSEGSRYMDPKRVRARHILVRVPAQPTMDDLEKARGKTAGYLKMIREGADFKEMAIRYSEGPTAPKGGDLGFFIREEMVKPFADLAFSLKPGEVGGPVRTPFGLHVVKVEEVKEGGLKTFESVKKQVREDLVKDEAARMALDAAEEFYDSLAPGTPLSKAATEFGHKYKEAVVVLGSPVKGLGEASDLVQSVFDMSAGEVSPLFESQEGRVVAELKEIMPSRLPELGEVRARVEAGYRAKQGQELAHSAAKKMLDDLGKTKDFEAAAQRAYAAVEEKGPVTREEGLPGISGSPQVVESVFSLTAESPIAAKVVAAGGKFYVFALKEATPAPEAGFEEQKKELIERYSEAKRRLKFEEFITMLRERAEIEILQEL